MRRWRIWRARANTHIVQCIAVFGGTHTVRTLDYSPASGIAGRLFAFMVQACVFARAATSA